MRLRFHGPVAAAVPLAALLGGDALARPVAASLFCETYPDAPLCAAGQVDCSLCHDRIDAPVAWNPYGESVRGAFVVAPADNVEFTAMLPAALMAVEDLDADGDGVRNRDEIAAGSLPGVPDDPIDDEATCTPVELDAAYDICRYDGRYALRKVMLEACGRSPTVDELAEVAEVAPEAQPDAVADALSGCLQGEFWRGRDGVVWRLAHAKIRPADFGNGEENSYGDYSEDGEPGEAGLNFFPDYALFVYTQIDGHDSRDLLLAQHYARHEVVDGRSIYTMVDELPSEGMPRERRAGMLTTRYYLTLNNMFTALPRTAAAQAYRAYLGLDIALGQGLLPVAGEPVDYDLKGVGAPDCARCHSTLDPLSYPFSRYDGVSGNTFDRFGTYAPDRLEEFYEEEIPGVTAMPEEGVILGRPVATLSEWAEVAANSEAFAAARVLDYWQIFFHAPPTTAENPAFAALVQRFRSEHDYAIDPMLRDLVRTEAYGVP